MKDHKNLGIHGTSVFAKVSFEDRIIEATKGMTFEQMHTYAVTQQKELMKQDVWDDNDVFAYDDLIEELESLDEQLIRMNMYDLHRQGLREEQVHISTLNRNRIIDQVTNYNNGLSMSVPFLRCNAQFSDPSEVADRYKIHQQRVMSYLVQLME